MQSIFDVSSFPMTRDFQTGNFAGSELLKIDSHFADFGQVKTDPNCSSLLNLGWSQLFF